MGIVVNGFVFFGIKFHFCVRGRSKGEGRGVLEWYRMLFSDSVHTLSEVNGMDKYYTIQRKQTIFILPPPL